MKNKDLIALVKDDISRMIDGRLYVYKAPFNCIFGSCPALFASPKDKTIERGSIKGKLAYDHVLINVRNYRTIEAIEAFLLKEGYKKG